MDNCGVESSLKSLMTISVKLHTFQRLLCLWRYCKSSACNHGPITDRKFKPTYAGPAKAKPICWMKPFGRAVLLKRILYFLAGPWSWSAQLRHTNFDRQDLLLSFIKHTQLCGCTVEGAWAPTSGPKQFDQEQSSQSHPVAETLLTLKTCRKQSDKEYLGGVLYSHVTEINAVFPFKELLSFTLLPEDRPLHFGKRSWNQYHSTGAWGFVTAHMELEDN